MKIKKSSLLIGVLCCLFSGYGQEICNNGIDDDGDGKIDLNDPDCSCTTTGTNSFLDNHDFEQMSYCPNDFTQFMAATGWFLPSSATSDYLNTCGFVPVSATDAGIYPLPPANGNGVAGILLSQDYKEFIARCTNAPLVAGTAYQLNFDVAASTSGRLPMDPTPNLGVVCNNGILNASTVELTLYGMTTCDTEMPQGNTNYFPPGWIPLGHVTYNPSKNWSQLSILFTPAVTINAVMLGSPRELPPNYKDEQSYRSCFPYFYFDNLVLNTAANLGVSINSSGNFCANTLELYAVTHSSVTGPSYQWYRDGIALPGATSATLSVANGAATTGNYQVMVTSSGGTCRLSPYYNVNTVAELPQYSVVQSQCFPREGTITITTPADEYSFDNGTTWTTNPVLTNAIPFYGPFGLVIKKNGCVSNAAYAVLESPDINTVYTLPELDVVQPGCLTNGSITVRTPAQEYSFDDGVTWTTNPVLDNLPANPAHEYKIRIKTLLGCITAPNTATMQNFLLPMPYARKRNTGCGDLGFIIITSPGTQYSIDDGYTWSTSNEFYNLTNGTYPIRIMNDVGCISAPHPIEIFEDIVRAPYYTVTQPSCGVLGSITVDDTAQAYSFDNGVTWGTSPTATNLAPGYHYVMRQDFQGCYSYAAPVYIQEYSFDAHITYTAVNPACAHDGSIYITSAAQEYSIDGGTTWSSSPSFTGLQSGLYMLQVRNQANCNSAIVTADLRDFTSMAPQYEVVDTGCGIYGSVTITTPADFYSFDGGSTWQTGNSITNLSGSYTFNLAIKNRNNCTSLLSYVYFNSNFTALPVATSHTDFVCDTANDSKEIINLTDYNTYLTPITTGHSFYYFTTAADAQAADVLTALQNTDAYELKNPTTTLYCAVVSPDGCHAVAPLILTLLPSPVPSVPDTVILCEDKSVAVNAGTGFSSYAWSTGETTDTIVINRPGDYSVTVSYTHGAKLCYATRSFTVVLSNTAVIKSISTTDFTENNNTIEINAAGYGRYEYSLDGSNYQDSNLFTGLAAGMYTAYVRDKNKCGIAAQEVFLLSYPKYFTPNADGANDNWHISFSGKEPGLTTAIFDRFGKLVKQLLYNESWDGTYNGRNLPSDDYWFLVTRKDGREFRGHFSLKR